MRGNELMPFAVAECTVPSFPIPMRGNEVFCASVNGSPSTVFPIPMRGNEGIDAGRQFVEQLAVPDPHEG